MNRVEKIENFSKLGYGLFIHFGVFSELDSGEWIWAFYNNKSKDVRVAHTDSKRVAIDDAFARWQPNQFDAKKIVSFAKRNGFRYITFTTRHHEGVSLYDTKGLSPIDITHKFKGRDFVKEIVDECHEQGVKIFLYHTLIDWYVPEFKDDIKKYLVYLRSSIELLCRNYGKIDGFWFDGSWTPYVADWEFEKLFKLIKTYQPDAMLINNGGLEAEGKALHEEWEVITFEQDDKVFDRFIKPKNYGLEICETLNDHWGVASRDYNYKALPYFIKKLPKHVVKVLTICLILV